MALEDPRDKGTRGQRTSEGRTGPAGDRGGGGGGIGGTKKAGNPTVADHLIATGGINVRSIGPNGMPKGNYPSQDDAYNDFARAIGDYATRGWVGRAFDWALGPLFNQQEPISQNPRTYADGTYHSSTNPAGAIASLAGMATGITAPVLPSLVGMGYNALGGQDIFHGGYSQPDTGVYSDPSSGWSGTAQSGGWGGSPSNQSNNGNHANQGGLLNINQPPSVNPAKPPMSAPTPANPMGTPNLLNIAYQPGGYQPVGGPTPYGVQTYPYQYPSY